MEAENEQKTESKNLNQGYNQAAKIRDLCMLDLKDEEGPADV
jgi:hypothetical protein